MSQEESPFWALSSYGAKSRQPIVVLRHMDWTLQVSPDVARKIASSIFEAAESAETDAFIFEWVQQACGADDGDACRLLNEFREWRERSRPK